jgi:predicted RNA-binding Zn-ribbon protein involved in translation (DUF1610 family)
MGFNLRKFKKAQLSTYDVDNLRQVILQNIDVIKGLSPADAPEAMAQFNMQLQNLGMTLQEAQQVVPELTEILQKQQEMQEQIPVPPLEESQSVILNPTAKTKKQTKVAFNLKRAQQAVAPMDPMGLNDAPELMGDQYEMQADPTNQSVRTFSDGADVRNWLENETDMQGALQFLSGNDDGAGQIDLAKSLVEDYYDRMGEPFVEQRSMERLAGEIFDALPPTLKKEQEIMATPKVITESGEVVQKLAKSVASHKKTAKTKSYNLSKQAQHKTVDNVIMWGPENTRKVDPFLRQPVSDWHIVERNKGFGLVVDDVWNIDWETLWRENIMDKYSRAYRNAEGEWVGGYLNKRFEIDRNIPATSNYQLKPGQRRKPVLPEYGSTEARLQAARAAGEIEGAIDKSKPFNWKEAQSKKKTEAGLADILRTKSRKLKDYQALFKRFTEIDSRDPSSPEAQQLKQEINKIRTQLGLFPYEQSDPKATNRNREQAGLLTYAQLKDLKPLKPLKLPGEKDPSPPQTLCTTCGSTLSENDKVCPNCGATQIAKGQPYQRKPSDPGPQPNPFTTNIPRFVQPGVPVTASNPFNDTHADEDEKTVRNVYVSDEFNQCGDPRELAKRKVKKDVDDKLDEVWNSCRDLEIDG